MEKNYDHIAEMHKEIEYVSSKLNGLKWFYNNKELLNSRIKDNEQLKLVEQQIEVMEQYLDILNKRLEYFENI